MAARHPKHDEALRLLAADMAPGEVARRLELKPATVRTWKTRQVRQLAAGDQNAYGNATPPPYGLAPYYGADKSSPIDQIKGTTAPIPDPGQVRPRVGGLPIGASGRANFYGLPQPDETNAQLMGPQGLRNFDLMYRTDPDIRRLVLMCASPIIAGTWDLRPFGGERATALDLEIAETCWWALAHQMSPNFFEHLNTMLPMLLRFGFVPFEQIWAACKYRGQDYIMPRKLDVRLPRSIWRWWQDDFGELTHIAQILPNKPDVVIPMTDIVYYRLAAEGDNWVGTSLLRHCYKPWVMKDRLERIDAIGQERKAVGVPIVYMPENADDQTRDAIETVLANLHTNEVGYLLMPGPHAQDVKDMPGMQGFRVDVIRFDSSSGDSIQASLKYHSDKIASAFLGDFMQLGHHQVGARATAQVQEDPFLTAIEALATYIMPPLNKLVARMVELNWPSAQGPPKLSLTLHDQASLTELSTYVVALITAGAMQADPELEDWMRNRADLPPANPDIRELRQQQKIAEAQAAIQIANQNPVVQSETPAQNEPSNQGIGEKAKGGKTPTGPPTDQSVRSKADVARGVGTLENPKTRQLASEPTVKWWEDLLQHDKLRQALDSCRENIEMAAKPATLLAAQKLAHQAVNGVALSPEPPEDLVNSLATHFDAMHRLGYGTVRVELGRQRMLAALPLTRAVPKTVKRAYRAAKTIMERTIQKLEQWRLNHQDRHGDVTQAQDVAETAASRALREMALDHTAAQINEGRAQAANDLDAAGAYRTAVLDNNTCTHCGSEDTGRLLTAQQALANPLPDPNCDGGDRCRCTYVWVMSSDAAAQNPPG